MSRVFAIKPGTVWKITISLYTNSVVFLELLLISHYWDSSVPRGSVTASLGLSAIIAFAIMDCCCIFEFTVFALSAHQTRVFINPGYLNTLHQTRLHKHNPDTETIDLHQCSSTFFLQTRNPSCTSMFVTEPH